MTTERACPELAALLAAYVDHEASPAETAHVEAHLAECEACRAELRRSQTGVLALDREVRALMSHGASVARQARPRGVLTRPDRLFEPATTRSNRISTFATVLVVGLLVAVGALFVGRGLARSAPIQTAHQPATSQPASTLTGPPVLVASVDGLVDPAVAAYVQRVASLADAQGAGGLVLEVSASEGLGPSVAHVKDALQTSGLPTRVVSVGRDSTTLVSELAQVTTQTVPDNAAGQYVPMTLSESLWHRLLDPTTAYLLLILGLCALCLELAHPGTLVPGLTGLVCLGLAAVSLIVLPTNWFAVLLLVGGAGLMAFEAHVGGHGFLVLGGGLVLLIGSVFLFTPIDTLQPWLAPIRVAPATLCLGGAFGLSVGALLARLAHRTAALPASAPLERLVGTRGEARSQLDPYGVVHIDGQLWSAHAIGAPLAAGEAVRVVARHGLILDVESAVYRPAATQKGALQ